MAGEAKKLDDGSFEAEVVGTPTPFQRELERLIADRGIEPANEPSNPPPARSAVRNVLLTGNTEAPESKVNPALREEAERTFAHIKALEGPELVEFRERIKTERPKLFAAMITLAEERNAASHAKSEAYHREFEGLVNKKTSCLRSDGPSPQECHRSGNGQA
jgi:hypothetical protein